MKVVILNGAEALGVLHFAWTDSAAVLFFWKGRQKCLRKEVCHPARWWREDCPTGFWSLEPRTSTLKRQSYKIKPQDKTKRRIRRRGGPGKNRAWAEAHMLTCPGCTALQHLCPRSTVSSPHLTSDSTPAAGAEEGQNFWLKCGYFRLEASWMLTRQWGVCACLTRQNNSYLYPAKHFHFEHKGVKKYAQA